MTKKRQAPLTDDERDEQLITDTLAKMMQRAEWGFWDQHNHDKHSYITNAEAFSLAVVAALAFDHLKGVYHSSPDTPPIHLSVAPHIEARYRDAVSATRGKERDRIHRRTSVAFVGLGVFLPISFLLNLTLLAIIFA